MTDEMFDKLRDIGDQIVHEHPDLILFAALQPWGMLGLWQIVISAPWAVGNTYKTIAYVVDMLMARFTKSELTKLSCVVVLNPDDESVYDIVRLAVPWKDGIKYLNKDCVINDKQILKGYVFVCNCESEIYTQPH
jgi:hypothetical protein